MAFTHYDNATSIAKEQTQYDAGLRSYMLQIYNYMAAALALTGIVAMVAGNSPAFMSLLYVFQDGRAVGIAPLGWLFTFAPLVMALVLGIGINRMTASTAQALFWLYAAVMGVSLSSIFLIYTGMSIARVFFITASVFGAMSLYGYTTKRDLTNFGSFLFMGLIGVVLASLVNIFLKSSGLAFALSILGVLIFVGLTAYDTQKIKMMYYELGDGGTESAKKLSILGALTLYLDFINLFLYMLRFFGDRKN